VGQDIFPVPVLVVLLGPYYMINYDRQPGRFSFATPAIMASYNAAIAEIAAAEVCLYVDVLAANGGTDWMVHYDGVHANDLGHRIIASAVFQVLAQNLLRLGEAHQGPGTRQLSLAG